MTELFSSLIEYYIFGKLKSYITLGPSYNLPNIYMAFVLVTFYPKRIKTRLDLLSQRPKSGSYVMEWEGVRHSFRPNKVRSLYSCDQCTFLCMS